MLLIGKSVLVMKLGLITDIHEHVENLQVALAQFERHGVDQVVVIGDVFEMGKRIESTCQLLAEAKAIGVWGNHDFGLAYQPRNEVRQRYASSVMDFMTSLRPRLEIAGCLFTHVEPWLNPEEIADLWYFDGPPDSGEKLKRIFDAAPNRIMFSGHFHRWLLATADGISDWSGDRPIDLSSNRFFVVIGALCEGRYATFDTETAVLLPFNQVIALRPISLRNPTVADPDKGF